MYSAKDAYRDAKENLNIISARKFIQFERHFRKEIKQAVKYGLFSCKSDFYSKNSIEYRTVFAISPFFEKAGYTCKIDEYCDNTESVPIMQLTISWDLSEEDNETET